MIGEGKNVIEEGKNVIEEGARDKGLEKGQTDIVPSTRKPSRASRSLAGGRNAETNKYGISP